MASLNRVPAGNGLGRRRWRRGFVLQDAVDLSVAPIQGCQRQEPPEQRRPELLDRVEDVATEEVVVVHGVPLQVSLSHQGLLRHLLQGVEVGFPWTWSSIGVSFPMTMMC